MPILRKKKQNKDKCLAVVDVGSNSVRLVIYHRIGNHYEVIHDSKANCRLAFGMKNARPRLSARGMRSALRALKKFSVLIEKNRVSKVLAIGTAAMRAVAHTTAGQTFHRRAERALGHKIKVISGRKEAQLTAHGLLAALPKAAGICGDLGGGSLELAAITRGRVQQTATLALGTLTLLSETRGNFLVADDLLDQRMRKVAWLKSPVKGRTFYATGGSWRALGRLMMKKRGLSTRSVHGFTIKAAQAEIYAAAIARQKPADFRAMSSKISRRADILPMAAAAMAKLIARTQPSQVTFSAHGVREGLVQQTCGLSIAR